ncbi:MAG: M48 family metalloprotease [Hyphomicrobiales bacterium]
MKLTLKRAGTALFAAGFLAASIITPVSKAEAQGGLIRDAEIETLLREYVDPIFKVAGLTPNAVKVYIINADSLNAFVAGGQRVFIHTGLLTRAKTPNELNGVLAHETGHIAGAHLAKMGIAMEHASTQSILSMLLAAAAVAGGAMAGNNAIASSGQGIMVGGQEMAKRNFLAYVRVQEASADQAGAKYLTKTKQSVKGMLDLFGRMANQSLASSLYIDPYLRSHPFELERIRNLERMAKKSPYYNKKDPPALVARHKLMQAKLVGYLTPTQVKNKYPVSDKSVPAYYARAIAAFRSGKMQQAVDDLNVLVKTQPKNPYFWELAGEALLSAGQIDHSIRAYKRAIKYAPNAGLIRVGYAKALIAQGNPASARSALKQLHKAQRTEDNDPMLHRHKASAYAKLGDIPRADLSTAEAYLRGGNIKLAKKKAGQAKRKLKKGTPQWRRADDILKITQSKS